MASQVLSDSLVAGNNTSDLISITVEFTGGLELLFSNERTHNVSLPAQLHNGIRPNITYLLQYLIDNVMKDQRRELFVLEGNVRPGILVLINDADWELEGEEKYELQQGDNIVFVSTLHGG
ncbi:Ubiquitin- modifier 1 [Monascus purpureus]|uniref:Ubiquitin-related modifier 1 n=1 Tax=Monascus purpureus TaxID=5098 RepID=A0A507QWR2_MONPU|nr:Ubiquitin- modifier 1 [Monascus purpureus]BDD56473.1 Ubiquitin- modifier 1 [Monascus purpureus]